ncbi:hypothetical protein BSLG_010562 [Batrachochytrium salamandrivorans]|nr:hypothetical protein BSLG_010562 [Batrachochytrium salamandrivorans]
MSSSNLNKDHHHSPPLQKQPLLQLAPTRRFVYLPVNTHSATPWLAASPSTSATTRCLLKQESRSINRHHNQPKLLDSHCSLNTTSLPLSPPPNSHDHHSASDLFAPKRSRPVTTHSPGSSVSPAKTLKTTSNTTPKSDYTADPLSCASTTYNLNGYTDTAHNTPIPIKPNADPNQSQVSTSVTTTVTVSPNLTIVPKSTPTQANTLQKDVHHNATASSLLKGSAPSSSEMPLVNSNRKKDSALSRSPIDTQKKIKDPFSNRTSSNSISHTNGFKPVKVNTSPADMSSQNSKDGVFKARKHDLEPNNIIKDSNGHDLNSSAMEVRKKKKTRARKDRRYLSKQALLPAIESIHVIKHNTRCYSSLFGSPIGAGETMQTVTLEYPGESAREMFPLVTPSRTSEIEYNPINDIYVTTQMIGQHCISKEYAKEIGDPRSGIIRSVIKACHRRDPIALQSAVSDFNAVVVRLKGQGVFEQDEIRGPPASCELITHILEQAYARSVAPLAHLLNNYEGFSNNVYGEIKHSFVRDIIKHADIQPHHTFLDMGSGIGNVIIQVAAECLCESYGIEIMDIPSDLAQKQKAEFLSRMRYYAKPCGRIVIKQGDFLEDPEIHEIISKADVIFVNNYAFDAALNHGIIAKFLDLKESAKVVSLRSFVPVDRRPSLRRSNAIESIFSVKELEWNGVDIDEIDITPCTE